ncbi:MAG TPA: hypothetical protein VHT34_03005 [Clostridia bacterium]|nr:hypothetical protein [Clostridia bacterium]
MNLKDNRLRAMKGFFYSDLIDSKALYIVGGCIFLGYLILTMATSLVMASLGLQSSSSGGTLTNGFGTTVICMFISGIVMAKGKQKKSAFSFPIDRLTYTICNFIMFFINTGILLIMSSVTYVFEGALGRILSGYIKNFEYVNNVTIGSFLIGFLVSLCYVLMFTCFTYCLFMFFARFKVRALIIFGLAAGLPFTFHIGRVALYNILMFFIGEQSPVILIFKLAACSVLFQVISYLPLRKMEVNA